MNHAVVISGGFLVLNYCNKCIDLVSDQEVALVRGGL